MPLEPPNLKIHRHPLVEELRLAACFAGVAMIGFCVDAGVLRMGLGLGLAAWSARIISLFCAMQVTFTINRSHIFRCIGQDRLLRQWSGYMLANGFGNFCNFWLFLMLVSTHWPVVSNHYLALTIGSACAWLINFLGTRLIVFPRVKTQVVLYDPWRGRGQA